MFRIRFQYIIFVIGGFVLVVVALAVAGGINNKTNTGQNNTGTDAPKEILRGVTLSPKSFQGSDFTDFFAKAKEAGQIISWHGNWNNMTQNDGAPHVVMQLVPVYGYTPLILTDIPATDFASKEKRAEFKASVVAFAQKYQPPYLGLGNEINFAYGDSRVVSDRISLYAEILDQVKKVSPKTKVFTVFQLEYMKGLRGGLFGKTSDEELEQWALLDQVKRFDLIAFTTYPGYIYHNPTDIPSNYFSEIREHTDKPIAFTEIGWFRKGPGKEWESGAQEQADFIKQFRTLVKSVSPEFAVWSFLYDQAVDEPATTMGLLTKDQKTSPAWEEWVRGL